MCAYIYIGIFLTLFKIFTNWSCTVFLLHVLFFPLWEVLLLFQLTFCCCNCFFPLLLFLFCMHALMLKKLTLETIMIFTAVNYIKTLLILVIKKKERQKEQILAEVIWDIRRLINQVSDLILIYKTFSKRHVVSLLLSISIRSTVFILHWLNTVRRLYGCFIGLLAILLVFNGRGVKLPIAYL